MTAVLVLTLALVVSANRMVVDTPIQVGVLELNHVYHWDNADREWNLILSQWITWEEYDVVQEEGVQRELHVWCWRMQKTPDHVSRNKGKWVLFGRGPRIEARAFHVTHTSEDRELADRHFFSPKLRRDGITGWSNK